MNNALLEVTSKFTKIIKFSVYTFQEPVRQYFFLYYPLVTFIDSVTTGLLTFTPHQIKCSEVPSNSKIIVFQKEIEIEGAFLERRSQDISGQCSLSFTLKT